jgi:hypothetical protein
MEGLFIGYLRLGNRPGWLGRPPEQLGTQPERLGSEKEGVFIG